MAETLRILIVDDEPGMRLGAERALAGFVVNLPEFNGDVSFSVDLAGTGEEALAKHRRGAARTFCSWTTSCRASAGWRS